MSLVISSTCAASSAARALHGTALKGQVAAGPFSPALSSGLKSPRYACSTCSCNAMITLPEFLHWLRLLLLELAWAVKHGLA